MRDFQNKIGCHMVTHINIHWCFELKAMNVFQVPLVYKIFTFPTAQLTNGHLESLFRYPTILTLQALPILAPSPYYPTSFKLFTF